MKTRAERQKFIQLRAEGLSLEKIARKMRISKQTLFRWSKKYESEIAELEAGRLEALREQYYLYMEAKVKMWGKIVNEMLTKLIRPSETAFRHRGSDGGFLLSLPAKQSLP